jgi:hypothetical protein
MGRKDCKAMKRAMGSDDEGFPAMPTKIGNVKLSRIVLGEESGCSRCFPHGFETNNSTESKNRRSWKNHRKTKYRPKKLS